MLLSKLWAYLAGFGAILVGIFAALGMAKRAGVKQEQAAETEKALQQAKESNEIAQKNRTLTDAAARDKLRRDQRD